MKQLRRANPEDAHAIAALAKSTFTETFGHLFHDPEDLQNYLEETFAPTKLEQSLQKPNNAYWITLVQGRAVGYAKLKLYSPCDFLMTEKSSQLQKIYVLKDFLFMKIGKGLQDAVLEAAKAYGSEEIWLSVLDTNERAIGFYRKNDFRTVGSHQFSIGKETFDFTVMSKPLS